MSCLRGLFLLLFGTSARAEPEAVLAARWAAGPGAPATRDDFDVVLRAVKDGMLPGAPGYRGPQHPVTAG